MTDNIAGFRYGTIISVRARSMFRKKAFKADVHLFGREL